MSEQKEILAKYIRYNREVRGLTLAQLAEMVGSSVGHIGNIERGTSFPSSDLLLRISETLGISYDTMLNATLGCKIDESVECSEDIALMNKIITGCDAEDREIIIRMATLLAELLKNRNSDNTDTKSKK